MFDTKWVQACITSFVKTQIKKTQKGKFTNQIELISTRSISLPENVEIEDVWRYLQKKLPSLKVKSNRANENQENNKVRVVNFLLTHIRRSFL